jgi:Zn-finger nucleic acid-binding protein
MKRKPMDEYIEKQAAIDAVISLCDDCDSDYCGSCRVNYPGEKDCRKVLEDVSPAQKKEYTKADYIMALHKEYGCSLAKAEEAHQKALEYLRNTSMMKG